MTILLLRMANVIVSTFREDLLERLEKMSSDEHLRITIDSTRLRRALSQFSEDALTEYLCEILDSSPSQVVVLSTTAS